MGKKKPKRRELSYDGSTNYNGFYGSEERWRKTLVDSWLDLPKHIGYWYEVEIIQVLTRQVDDGWQVLLKGQRGGKPLISYVWGETWFEAVELTVFLADRDGLDWSLDRFPPKRRALR